MARSVKKSVGKKAVTLQAQAMPQNVAGVGFKKKFTATELKKIKTKRSEMKKRLFAVG